MAATFIQPAASEVKSGSSTIKIILIVVAIVFGLGILSVGSLVFVGYRIAKSAHVDANGAVTMNMPGGAITTTPMKTVTAAELGAEIYPGAQSLRGGMKTEMPNSSMVTGIFLTSDSSAQVTAFYKEKLGSAATAKSFFGHQIIQLKEGSQEFVQVIIDENSAHEGGKTRITIQHSISKKAS
ncbi:MAG: hypothetical protein WAN35_15280 [Terracidiphilus sp.]